MTGALSLYVSSILSIDFQSPTCIPPLFFPTVAWMYLPRCPSRLLMRFRLRRGLREEAGAVSKKKKNCHTGSFVSPPKYLYGLTDGTTDPPTTPPLSSLATSTLQSNSSHPRGLFTSLPVAFTCSSSLSLPLSDVHLFAVFPQKLAEPSHPPLPPPHTHLSTLSGMR